MGYNKYSPSTVEELKVVRRAEFGLCVDGGIGDTCDDMFIK